MNRLRYYMRLVVRESLRIYIGLVEHLEILDGGRWIRVVELQSFIWKIWGLQDHRQIWKDACLLWKATSTVGH